MAELEIEGTHEEQFAIVKTAVKEHNLLLKGNGQPGIVEFVTASKAQLRLIVFLLVVILPLIVGMYFKR